MGMEFFQLRNMVLTKNAKAEDVIFPVEEYSEEIRIYFTSVKKEEKEFDVIEFNKYSDILWDIRNIMNKYILENEDTKNTCLKYLDLMLKHFIEKENYEFCSYITDFRNFLETSVCRTM